ncbi:MAG TPA: hypothetical protein VF158_10585 [Longimicrobiales bacterium]
MESRIVRGWRAAPTRAAVLILTLFSAGCNTIEDPTEHYAQNARIEVTGTSPVPLLLVSSTQWAYKIDPATGERVLEIASADTTTIELPAEKTVGLAPTYRILFRVINPDTAETATVRMRVHLDEELVYDVEGTLRDASLEYMFQYYGGV